MIQRIISLAPVLMLAVSMQLQASQEIWQDVSPQAKGIDTVERLYQLDDQALRSELALVPHEALGDHSFSIQLPMPNGKLMRFEILESPIMQPGLAADFPEIKTYKVYGIDDPFASGRVDISPRGFHGMLHTSQGRVFIDPDHVGQGGLYRSRKRGGQLSQGFSCGIHELDFGDRPALDLAAQTRQRIPGMLLEYRLAVAATKEYVDVPAIGGTVVAAQTAIVTAINRVNQIYERDLGIHLTLVAGNQNLIEDGANVSFSNDDGATMLFENQAWLDSPVLGTGNYDIGHVFSTGGGGLARLGAVCDAAIKAQGVTGHPNPIDDPFYIDFVAHEIGHQFNADHTFNGTDFACGVFPNRNSSTAFEPGSGSTIMAYAGICGVEDLQLNSDATFHAGSITQIDSFVGVGGGSACDNPIATVPPGNNDPVITAIAPRNIPVETPFELDGSASDVDGATILSYQWDQLDTGTATNSLTFGTDQGDNPLFRSYEPQATAARSFPALGTLVQGLFDDAEVIPCKARELDFRLTVRDNNSGQDTEDVRITVAGNAGPFRVTSQAFNTTILFNNTTFLVSWDVANTDAAPVSCNNVAIDLIAFKDDTMAPINTTYTTHTVHTLVASTPNSGSAIVPAPSQWIESPSRGRLRVRCLNNVFYALSEGDLQVVGDFPKTLFDDDDIVTFFNNNGTTGGVAPICDAPSSGIPVPSGTGTHDATAFGGIWLVLLGGLAVFRQLWRRQG